MMLTWSNQPESTDGDPGEARVRKAYDYLDSEGIRLRDLVGFYLAQRVRKEYSLQRPKIEDLDELFLECMTTSSNDLDQAYIAAARFLDIDVPTKFQEMTNDTKE